MVHRCGRESLAVGLLAAVVNLVVPSQRPVATSSGARVTSVARTGVDDVKVNSPHTRYRVDV
ncbi:MAG TPA: hypothetical protein VK281_01740 [Xanthobacteraceae bacterium]|nr:hypothetical protein [Xanthobacteraceae bacterium]